MRQYGVDANDETPWHLKKELKLQKSLNMESSKTIYYTENTLKTHCLSYSLMFFHCKTLSQTQNRNSTKNKEVCQWRNSDDQRALFNVATWLWKTFTWPEWDTESPCRQQKWTTSSHVSVVCLHFWIPQVRRYVLFTNLVHAPRLFCLCWRPRVNLLQINAAQARIWKFQQGLTVDNGGVDDDASQVRIGHGFVQDEAADAGKINIWEASAVKASDK